MSPKAALIYMICYDKITDSVFNYPVAEAVPVGIKSCLKLRCHWGPDFVPITFLLG